jgi:2,5-dihydroxypyridine 5,6-dioxygenase
MDSAFPISYTTTGELFPFFLEELKLCKVQKGETVVLHCDSHTYPHYPAAFMGAAIELGADVYQLVHPRSTPHQSITEVWKAANIVIDLRSYPTAYEDIITQALLSGTRILRVGGAEAELRRLFPTTEIRSRAVAGAKILTAGNTLKIQSQTGTDLVLDITNRTADALYSIADIPGRWDIWPSGLVVTTAIEDSAEGTLVLDVGDHLRGLDRYIREPVYITIQRGRIIKIEGGLEAWILRTWFEQFHDPNTYVVAHIGWGCENRANWHKPGQDPEVYYGNMQIAFGSNTGHFTEGKNRAKGHIDMPCLNNSIWVDDVQIMEHGEFLVDDLK